MAHIQPSDAEVGPAEAGGTFLRGCVCRSLHSSARATHTNQQYSDMSLVLSRLGLSTTLRSAKKTLSPIRAPHMGSDRDMKTDTLRLR